MKLMIMKTYYILRGDHEELARAELYALLEIYGFNGRIDCYTMICIVHGKYLVDKIIHRSGYIREGGILLGEDQVFQPRYEWINKVGKQTFSWIKASIAKSTVNTIEANKYLVNIMEKTGLPIKYRRGKMLHLIFSEDKVFAGSPTAIQDTKNMYRRRPSNRPFFRSIALTPQFSRLLINLARVREGEILLDPFMGTGSILIEASSMDIFSIGVELDKELVKGGYKNISYYGLQKNIIIHGDSLFLEYAEVDGIATDPPYGRAASTHGLNNIYVYEEFLARAVDSVKRRGYIVFMAPRVTENYIDELICSLGLIIVDKHYVYIHGGLTRTIYGVYRP